MSEPVSPPLPPTVPKPGRWKRRLRWTAIVLLLLCAVCAFLVKDHVRTLYSLHRVPGTHAYVMDYYADYHIDKIRQHGMDVDHIEDTCINTLLPCVLVPLGDRLKQAYFPKQIRRIDDAGHHCSAVALHGTDGHVFFGRNLDFGNDACLILRIHDADGLASISVIDLAYLNLNRPDLERLGFVERIPLLFAPFYVMDGVNRHGVAVGDLAVSPVKPPVDPKHPDILLATLQRLILDYAHDVDEAVELAKAYNVHFVVTSEHFMVADAAGRSRILEFIDGQLRVTPGEGAWQICTNDIVWNKSLPDRAQTCHRFRTGSEQAKQLKGAVTYADARHVTRSMSVVDWTMWTSVYDLTSREMHLIYRTADAAEYSDSLPPPTCGP